MGNPNVYVPITGPDNSTAIQDISAAVFNKAVSGIEIRYDMFKEEPDIGELMNHAQDRANPIPVMFTNMRVGELPKDKGGFPGTDDEWVAIHDHVAGLDLRPEYISVGAGYSGIMVGRKHDDISYILSHHWWDKSPSMNSLAWTFEEPDPLYSDVVKIAAMAKTPGDAKIMFEFLDRPLLHQNYMGREDQRKRILLPMGRYGVWMRVIGCDYGNLLTFAALSPAKVSGPGQPTIDELVEARRLMQMPTGLEDF